MKMTDPEHKELLVYIKKIVKKLDTMHSDILTIGNSLLNQKDILIDLKAEVSVNRRNIENNKKSIKENTDYIYQYIAPQIAKGKH